DVDFDSATADVCRSYHLGELGDTKTVSSFRGIELFPLTVTLLRAIRPTDPNPAAPVFTTTTGGRIEPKAFSDYWYECLADLGIRKRGLYCTKDSFVTTAVTVGAKIGWLENQTGVNYA